MRAARAASREASWQPGGRPDGPERGMSEGARFWATGGAGDAEIGRGDARVGQQRRGQTYRAVLRTALQTPLVTQ